MLCKNFFGGVSEEGVKRCEGGPDPVPDIWERLHARGSWVSGIVGQAKTPADSRGGSRIDGGLLVEHLHGIDQAAPHAVERLRQ